jgi:hypothetical protein
MDNELIVKEQLDVAKLFTDDGLQDILKRVEKQALSFVFEVNTPQGRKDIASLAHQVARSKTLIDGIGKEMVADWKEKAKRVDGYRKQARDFLDDLKSRVRHPLDEWEAEQKQIEEEKARKAREKIDNRMAELSKYGVIPSYLDVASWDDEIYKAKLTELKTAWEAEQARLKAEEEARKAEAARLEKIRKEQEAAQKEIEEARRKIEEERHKIEAEKRAEQERKDREEFERQAIEQARIEAEKAAKEKAEREAAEAERKRLAEIECQKAEEAERARQEALKPDKEKLKAWADSLLDIEPPKLSNKRSRMIADQALQDIHKIVDTILATLEAL